MFYEAKKAIFWVQTSDIFETKIICYFITHCIPVAFKQRQILPFFHPR